MATRKKTAASTDKKITRTARARARGTGSGNEPPIVVYIHGIGAQSPADQMKLNWDIALFGRDMGEKSRMAFWADILHPAGVSVGAIGTRATDEKKEVTVNEALAAAGLAGSDKKAAAYAEGMLELLSVTARAPGPRKKITGLPIFIRKPGSS